MTKRRRSPERSFLVIFGQLPFVIIGIGALLAALAGWIPLTTAAAAFGVSLLGSVLFAAWGMRSYRCPECGAKLLPPRGWWRRFPNEPILLRCVPCDTDWDFGIKGHGD
jgi:hypothetical protein